MSKKTSAARHINVAVVHDDASTTSTQCYTGDIVDAFDAAFDIVARAEFGHGWQKRVVAVFVHDTRSGNTWHMVVVRDHRVLHLDNAVTGARFATRDADGAFAVHIVL